jgi:hypothetical protein
VTVSAIIDAMFARTLEQSRVRPRWLTTGDPESDARYRMAVSLAAPVLLAAYLLLAVLARHFPTVLNHRSIGPS